MIIDAVIFIIGPMVAIVIGFILWDLQRRVKKLETKIEEIRNHLIIE